MNKNLFWYLVLFIVLGCGPTQNFYMKTVKLSSAKISNKMKIAVISENWYWLGSPNFLPRALITEFLEMGFVVIERSQLENILKEVELGLKGVTKQEKLKQSQIAKRGVDFGILDKISIKKFGEILGVDALLVTYIVPNYNDGIDKATFRLVDTKTAKVLFSMTFINKKVTSPSCISLGKLIPIISSHIKQLLAGSVKVETDFSVRQSGKIKIITTK